MEDNYWHLSPRLSPIQTQHAFIITTLTNSLICNAYIWLYNTCKPKINYNSSVVLDILRIHTHSFLLECHNLCMIVQIIRESFNYIEEAKQVNQAKIIQWVFIMCISHNASALWLVYFRVWFIYLCILMELMEHVKLLGSLFFIKVIQVT